MPINPGEHADLLRAIGRLLDREAALDVQLSNNGTFLTLSWRSPTRGADERHYEAHNLEELRSWAREARGDLQPGRGFFADLFRTLGQDLDREQAEFTEIRQEGDALAVTGSASGRYLRQTYYAGELQNSSQRRRGWRQNTGAPAPKPVREAASPSEPSRPVEPLPTQGSIAHLSHLIESAEGPLLRRMREAQQRPDQEP